MWSVRASFFDHLRASVAGKRRPLERDDFSSNRHPAPSFCLSMISAQTLRVCREGKPVPTFPDHALVLLSQKATVTGISESFMEANRTEATGAGMGRGVTAVWRAAWQAGELPGGGDAVACQSPCEPAGGVSAVLAERLGRGR